MGPGIKAAETHLRTLISDVAVYPQRGPQEKLFRSTADLIVYGGAAGGGKTWAALYYPIQFLTKHAGFTATYFRKSRPEITAAGGLWQESQRMWTKWGARFRELPLDVSFKNGSKVKFEQLYNESDKVLERLKGSQMPWFCLEEATGFLERTAVYLLSRNRSPIPGIRGRALWTCNPDRDSWLFHWVRPWVDPHFTFNASDAEVLWYRRFDEGKFPPSVAPFVRAVDGDMVWVREGCPLAASITYISARLDDNAILVEGDPSYIAKLEAQDPVQRARLKDGDWMITYGGGNMFKSEWFTAWMNELGYTMDITVRSWDFAVTLDGGDYTAGVKVSRWIPPPRYSDHPNLYVVEDVIEVQLDEARVQALVRETAKRDGRHCRVILQQGKGDEGRLLVEAFRRHIIPKGTSIVVYRLNGSKIVRAKPYSGLASRGMVFCLPAKWNKRFVAQHQKFPESKNDDIVDAASVAILHLDKGKGMIKPALGTSSASKGMPRW